MPLRRLSFFAVALLILAALRFSPSASAGDEWQPISPEELKMTSVTEAPGAPAVILYRQVDRNDIANNEYNYVRIKILTEEGRKQANVEIPMFKTNEHINNIRARTIHPDGSIAVFDGQTFTSPIVKAKGIKYMAKTFTLPDVQIGSIIEYHYMADWEDHVLYNSYWLLSEDLFTRYAKFSLKAYNRDYSLRWSWPAGLPTGTKNPVDEGGTVRLECRNIPAFQTEDYMPPENELKMRVVFTYSLDRFEQDVEKYWKNYAKKRDAGIEGFVNKKKAMEEALSQIVAPSDSPEVKLQKIYARVQQIRNTSYENAKTAEETKREKLKEVSNVEDIWKKQYSDGYNVDWLFLALVRAAGMEAYPVFVSTRNEYFFRQNTMDSEELNANVVMVKLNGKELYFDPGTKFNPYGYLPWYESGVIGRRVDKDGGSWVNTTLLPAKDSQVLRKAKLKISSEDGSLEGDLTVTYTGLEALSLRLDQRNQDETSRKKLLEDQVQGWIPAGIETTLKNKPAWEDPSVPFVAEFSLKVPGWISAAGKRALLPVGLFGNPEKHVFEHADRTHPIYMNYPSAEIDDVSIELPAGWQVSSLPKPVSNVGPVISYTMTAEKDKGTLHLSRSFNTEFLLLETKYYGPLRNFFQMVRTTDEEQVVLQPGSAAASN